MSTAYSHEDVHVPYDVGPTVQFGFPTATSIGLATAVGASGSVQSNLILSNGYKSFAFAVTSTQAGSVSVQRYLDQAGSIPQGAALTVSLTANNQGIVNATDGVPFQSLKITVNNTAGSAATLSNPYLLLQAN